MSSNPYAAPRAAVSDIDADHEYQEIQMWSAKGRIGRLRYLAYSTGASLLAGLVAAALAAIPALGNVLIWAIYIAVAVFSVFIAIQRSHDMNWSGWSVLLTLIPLVALIWVFKPGTPGVNDYGAPPPPNTTGVKILGMLLPIVFLIGILAAIALPAYVDYTRRAAGG